MFANNFGDIRAARRHHMPMETQRLEEGDPTATGRAWDIMQLLDNHVVSVDVHVEDPNAVISLILDDDSVFTVKYALGDLVYSAVLFDRPAY